MEFGEKLQQLRRQKGLTQEELAQALYVSRTAVSKWESGRGYPNIDSLKAIAAYFSVTVDALLSGGEALNLAEAENRQKEEWMHSGVFGLLDVSAVLLVFLPIFGYRANGAAHAVSLLFGSALAPYLRAAYLVFITAQVVSGVVMLALKDGCRAERARRISIALSAMGVLLFIISPQPYAATMVFVFLIIKGLLLAKKP